MDDGEHSVPVSSSIHKNRKLHKLRRAVHAVLPVVRLLKLMKRLCLDPAAVKISTRKRKARENLNTSDQHEYPGHLQLKFSNNISGPIYTGLPIGDQEGRTLDLHLIDSHTQNIFNSGPEASAKVEIVVLEKDFTSFGGDKSLIRGNPQVSLKDGRVSVSHISFKHTRVPLKNLEVRLGARVVNPHDIRTAVTKPFFVKDRRSMGKSLKPLFLEDEVWKLQNIGKGGAFHNRLMDEKISTVRDFLTNYFLNCENLLKILGRRMHGKKLDAAVNQAKGKLELKRYMYLHENSRVVFTDVGELIGVQHNQHEEGQFVPVEQLTQTQKDSGMKLVKRALQVGHQNFKVLLDDDSFQMLFPSSSPNKAAHLDGSNNYPNDTQQLQPAPYDVANYIPTTSLINNYDYMPSPSLIINYDCMPSTSLINNYDYINRIRPHPLDPDYNDFTYQVLPASIWD